MVSNHEQWMYEAAKVAEKALCTRAKCGTVIIKDGEIIGSGYNAPPLDKVEDTLCDKDRSGGKDKYDRTCCMHAEWRAILDVLRNNSSKIEGSDLYFTRVDNRGEILFSGEPFCTVCSRLALDVGIKNFILWHEDGIRVYDTREYNELSYNYGK